MKERLDKIVLARGIAGSREKARALIMEGNIMVDGSPVTKAGTLIDSEAAVESKSREIPYVSRGGIKISAALKHFGISVHGMTAMDVGSSTGGFTDCLLQNGAKKVYCIDVGYGQISLKLRNDPRVMLFERTNIRHLDKERITDPIDIATIDVSFISLKLVLPKVMEFLGKNGAVLALVKPQFEVGKGEVGKGGIVRDEEKRMSAVVSVREYAESVGLKAAGLFQSPIAGQKGNIEYFLYLKEE